MAISGSTGYSRTSGRGSHMKKYTVSAKHNIFGKDETPTVVLTDEGGAESFPGNGRPIYLSSDVDVRIAELEKALRRIADAHMNVAGELYEMVDGRKSYIDAAAIASNVLMVRSS